MGLLLKDIEAVMNCGGLCSSPAGKRGQHRRETLRLEKSVSKMVRHERVELLGVHTSETGGRSLGNDVI